ncbi:LOG family protein [Sorangium cellulosum]|uniref:Cytokinin riboside 5'-monophosphate phosphoribohydrolase n=1 Tax=Sorangium cellulosum TaxID=56 RepID=A0A2L0EZP5_SORCE|nr:TIGR00730 family Rossman fold protein [Sorangium cellulosum]AUX44709.1 LOG family protein [Sorangium cellulosum]
MTKISRICVYCGSNPGASPAYREAAVRLGELLAERGIGLVYGGGRVGLMGAVADAALARGGEVIGVIPHFLKQRELDHQGLMELVLVDTMHERKARMAALADAFIAMPGGIGTLEELFEVWTWTQLGSQEKPVGLLDVQGFYRPLITFLDHVVTEQFLRPGHRAILQVSDDAAALVDRLAAWRPVVEAKWMTPSET